MLFVGDQSDNLLRTTMQSYQCEAVNSQAMLSDVHFLCLLVCMASKARQSRQITACHTVHSYSACTKSCREMAFVLLHFNAHHQVHNILSERLTLLQTTCPCVLCNIASCMLSVQIHSSSMSPSSLHSPLAVSVYAGCCFAEGYSVCCVRLTHQ